MTDSNTLSSHQERMEKIFQLLSQQRMARVSDLQELLGVSDMTVRRCLNLMAADGLIKRVHGGAVAIEGGQNKFMQMRYSLNADVKAMLADLAFEFMPENSSIFLDSGTTCFAVAKRLATGGKKLTIVTDSIKVLRELQGVRHLNTIVLGGALSDDMITIEGPFTVEAATRVTTDICFFSADGFTCEQLEQKYLTGVMTKKVVMPRSRRKVCICDSSKYDTRCCFKFCGWDEVDVFLSDARLPAGAKEGIAGKGVEVRLIAAQERIGPFAPE